MSDDTREWDDRDYGEDYPGRVRRSKLPPDAFGTGREQAISTRSDAATREWDATNAVRLCDRCEREQGVSAGADAGDRACSACGSHDAPHVYPALGRSDAALIAKLRESLVAEIVEYLFTTHFRDSEGDPGGLCARAVARRFGLGSESAAVPGAAQATETAGSPSEGPSS